MNWREYDLVVLNTELSPLHARLYCYLRRHMDIISCVVGDADKKMVSYKSIQENLEYRPRWGSRDKPIDVSRDQVKRMLARLVEIGALRRLQGTRYGIELRFFLPFAVQASIRPEEERHRSAIAARHSQTQQYQGFQGEERHRSATQERHTSEVITLSQNNYKYYSPDDDDWAWLRYQKIDLGNGRGDIDVGMETEKFNLKYSGAEDYDMSLQRADWRMWMLRAVEFRAEKRNQGW